MTPELESRIKVTTEMLEHLSRAAQRASANQPCPAPIDHVTEIIQVVSGYLTPVVAAILEKYQGQILQEFGGYQLRRCLACKAYLLYRYSGEFVAPILEDEARILR